MVDHLSPLVLDTVAAGLPFADTARVHLESCEECRTRLESVKNERAVTMKNSRFAAGQQRLVLMPIPAGMPSWVPRVVGLAIAASATLVIGYQFLVRPPATGTLLKGQVSVELVQQGGSVVRSAHVGDRLDLAVGGAGYGQVAVLVVAEDGKTSVLHPSSPLAKGARVPLGKGFEVTAGSLLVVACFSDAPLPDESLRAMLEQSAAALKAAGKSPLEATAPAVDGAPCAKATLAVMP